MPAPPGPVPLQQLHPSTHVMGRASHFCRPPFAVDDMLTPADPAPFVVLRLRDTPETRELWPHAFEVLYKITLMEDDSVEEEPAGPDVGQDPQVWAEPAAGCLVAAAGCRVRA
jgi:hypothetical protein